jgi:putative ABC transport system substrate-binding protein
MTVVSGQQLVISEASSPWSVVTKAISCLALCAMLFPLCFSAEAQQPKKVPLIGYLGSGSAHTGINNLAAFKQGLRGLGYIEGKNVVIEPRFAEGKLDRLPDLAAELVRLKVDVIVTGGSPGTHAAQQATRTVPLVMTVVGDPVPRFVASLAKPGGNITGLTQISRELSGKRLELLKEAFPKISRVAVFVDAALTAQGISGPLQETQIAAEALSIKLHSLEVRGPNPDLDVAFRTAKSERVGALITLPSPIVELHRQRVVELAAKSRLPAIYPSSEFVEAGGLMSYGPDRVDLYRRAAVYVDKILKGAKPSDLPVEQPTKFEFVINLKAAKRIGLTIPPNVLARADRVIR